MLPDRAGCFYPSRRDRNPRQRGRRQTPLCKGEGAPNPPSNRVSPTGSCVVFETASVPTNLTTNAFARSGYTFTGWSTNTGGGGTTYANGASYLFNANVTLYAQWSTAAAIALVAGSTSSTKAGTTGAIT